MPQQVQLPTHAFCRLPATRSKTHAAGLPLDLTFQPGADGATAVGDLPTVIHPIFSRRNIDPSRIDYGLFQPALILATKLISAPALLSFWYTTFFSDVRPAEHILRRSRTDCYAYEYTDVPSTLSDEQVRRTQTALLDFAPHLWYSLWTPELEGWAECSSMEARLSTLEPFAYIMVSPDIVTDLRKGAELSERMNDQSFYALESFIVARGLVHELAHAVRLVVRGRDDYYFPTATIDEGGLEWEGQVFGGFIERSLTYQWDASGAPDLSSIPEIQPQIITWPSSELLCHYIFHDYAIGLRLSNARPPLVGQVAHNKNIAGAMAASFHVSHIEQMFTKAFWDEEVTVRGVQAMQPSDPKYFIRPFPRDWVTPLLNLYDKAAAALDEDMEMAQAEGESSEYRRLHDLRYYLRLFYDCWNI